MTDAKGQLIVAALTNLNQRLAEIGKVLQDISKQLAASNTINKASE